MVRRRAACSSAPGRRAGVLVRWHMRGGIAWRWCAGPGACRRRVIPRPLRRVSVWAVVALRHVWGCAPTSRCAVRRSIPLQYLVPGTAQYSSCRSTGSFPCVRGGATISLDDRSNGWIHAGRPLYGQWKSLDSACTAVIEKYGPSTVPGTVLVPGRPTVLVLVWCWYGGGICMSCGRPRAEDDGKAPETQRCLRADGGARPN